MTAEQAAPQRGAERPLITFQLMAYNQERFIREAVAGALAQTYSPLEIVLSDDCSTDRTFEIMSEMAQSYQGPHRIVLNRNPRNLGIGAHMNRAVQLAGGELIVDAAGDDVSHPDRSERVYLEWDGHGRGICSIYSDAWVISDQGARSGLLLGHRAARHAPSAQEAIARRGCGVPGCSHAFSKRLFEIFGPMQEQIVAEDLVIPFRSLLAGKVLHVNEPLISYRVHDANVSIGSGRPSLDKRRRDSLDQQNVFLSWLQDIKTANLSGLLGAEESEAMLYQTSRLFQTSVIEANFFQRGLLPAVLYLLANAVTLDLLKYSAKLLERRLRSR